MRKILFILAMSPLASFAQCPQWILNPLDSATRLIATVEKFLKIKFKEIPLDKVENRTSFSYEAAAAEATADALWTNSRYYIYLDNEKDSKGNLKAIEPWRVTSIRIVGPNPDMNGLLKYVKDRIKNCDNYLENNEERVIRFGKSLLAHGAIGIDRGMMTITIQVDLDSSKSTDHELLAVNQKLNKPEDLAVDSSGNIFFADTYNDRICKIEKATGKLITIAGTGTGGFSGDGSPAVNAQLNQPSSLVLTQRGDLYFGDRGNARIRKIDGKTGIINSLKVLNSEFIAGVKKWQMELLNEEELYFIESLPFLQKLNVKTGVVTLISNVMYPDCFTINPITKKLIVAIANEMIEVDPTELKVLPNNDGMRMVELRTKKILDGRKVENSATNGLASFEKIRSMSSDKEGTIYFSKEGDSAGSIYFFNLDDRIIKSKQNVRNNGHPVPLTPISFTIDQDSNFYIVGKDAASILKVNFEKEEISIIGGTGVYGKGFDPVKRIKWLVPNKN